jgi:2,4-dienoyl-CoA reductase-like NADH-dependent reductase (Old Yellow Enzyme family)
MVVPACARGCREEVPVFYRNERRGRRRGGDSPSGHARFSRRMEKAGIDLITSRGDLRVRWAGVAQSTASHRVPSWRPPSRIKLRVKVPVAVVGSVQHIQLWRCVLAVKGGLHYLRRAPCRYPTAPDGPGGRGEVIPPLSGCMSVQTNCHELPITLAINPEEAGKAN